MLILKAERVSRLIEQFQKVRLKNGKVAVIIEILDPNKAFLADVQMGEGDYETDEIHAKDIQTIFEEVERAFVAA